MNPGLALSVAFRLALAWLPLGTAAANAPSPPAAFVSNVGWADQVDGGHMHTCALTLTGGVKCWGDNSHGQLGDGSRRSRAGAGDDVDLQDQAKQVSAGTEHTCVVTQAGAALCWGANTYGQLGDGTMIDRLTPTGVTGLSNGVRAISAGEDHTCALLESGQVECWGRNDQGQLGDGTTVARVTPGDVQELAADSIAIDAGYTHTCALGATGQLRCWGDNRSGQLGDGTQISRLKPVTVADLDDGVRMASLGDHFTCAVTTPGAAKCWGFNSTGQLGDGTQISRLTPVAVVGLSDGVTELRTGGAHACASVEDGEVKCWGYNANGAIGDGTYEWRFTPADVVGLSARATNLGLGAAHSCAVLTNGASQCWGWNGSGQLGDGTTTLRRTPVEVWNLDYECAAATDVPGTECSALVALFHATNGSLWSNHAGWLQTTTPCSWYGVTCEAGHVSQLSLPYNNLVDSLPPGLGALTALRRLDLSSNLLGGAPPADLGNLTALQQLDLSNNRLAGPLPLALTNLRTFLTLDLHANGFSGELPALDTLSALQYLDVSANAFGGRIPVTLGDLSQLQHLDLSHNQLADDSESIFVPALAKLKHVRYLDLSYNQLIGPLPWWSEWTDLEHIDLSHNAFEGYLPWQPDGLPHLQYVALHSNHLTGPIPAAWGRIGAGMTPAATRAAPPEGVYIDLSGNHLYGPIPAELGQNPALMGLELSGNQLSGAVPSSFTDRQFYCLDLNHNQLTPAAPCAMDWCGTQTLPPTDLRATMTDAGLALAWTMASYPNYYGGYEISYATAPNGPFTLATYLHDTRWENYTITGVSPAATYYARLRTVSHARTYSLGSPCLDVFDHEYIQPNNLWSDYTPLVCVNCRLGPDAGRAFLPFVTQ